MATNGLAGRFTRVCYVVHDIEATAKWFSQALGVEFCGVRSYQPGGPDSTMTAGGQPVSAAAGIKLALARAGGRGELEIELLQPDGGDSVFSRYLENSGGGLHHVAFEVDDFDAAARTFAGEGTIAHTLTSSSGTRTAYFDCRDAGASIIELTHFDRATHQDRERLKSPSGAVSTQTADPKMPRLVQISYVVSDLDALTGWFKRVIGVKHFGITKATAGRDYQVLVKDEPVATPFSLRTAMGRVGPQGEQEIEIIQPVEGPSPYRDFIERSGSGLNHVSFLVPDFEPAAERMRGSGAKPLIEFRGHGIRACYFDCSAADASIVEIGYFDEKATAALERVKTPRD
jgi:methylmalonyl-CoA/ethylmalonyl-CoA epimerase